MKFIEHAVSHLSHFITEPLEKFSLDSAHNVILLYSVILLYEYQKKSIVKNFKKIILLKIYPRKKILRRHYYRNYHPSFLKILAYEA